MGLHIAWLTNIPHMSHRVEKKSNRKTKKVKLADSKYDYAVFLKLSKIFISDRKFQILGECDTFRPPTGPTAPKIFTLKTNF